MTRRRRRLRPSRLRPHRRLAFQRRGRHPARLPRWLRSLPRHTSPLATAHAATPAALAVTHTITLAMQGPRPKRLQHSPRQDTSRLRQLRVGSLLEFGLRPTAIADPRSLALATLLGHRLTARYSANAPNASTTVPCGHLPASSPAPGLATATAAANPNNDPRQAPPLHGELSQASRGASSPMCRGSATTCMLYSRVLL